MKIRNQLLLAFASILFLFLIPGNDQVICADDTTVDSIVIDGSLHDPSQLMKLIERSILMYQLSALPDSAKGDLFDSTRQISLSTERYVTLANGRPTIHLFSLSDTLMKMFAAADSFYGAKEYDRAIRGYRRVYELDTSYHRILVLIGDGFYSNGLLDSAIAYFRKGIERNFIDYQAHWFLADALWKNGDEKGATREITLAHILNFYHADIPRKLRQYREATKHEWKEWSFEPRYSVFRNAVDSHVVEVQVDTAWIGYALVKALWKFEPGYAEKMLGRVPGADEFNTLEESEATLSQAVSPLNKAPIMDVLQAGYLKEFVLYELLARRYPDAMATIAPEELVRIADYIDKYH